MSTSFPSSHHLWHLALPEANTGMAQGHGKAVRQRTVRQCTTKHNAGTLPLNMWGKELSIGERVTFENASQDSEYDSGSDEEERESAKNQGFPWPQCDQLFIKMSSFSLWQSYFLVTSSSSFVPIDQYFFERPSAAALLCLWLRSPISGFSKHAHQTRPLFAFGLGAFTTIPS